MRHDVGERRRAAVVEVRRVLPERTQRRRAIRLVRRARRVRPVDAGVRRRVQCPAVVIGAGPANVAARARPVKHRSSTRRDRRIEASGRRRRRRQAVLVRAQRRELGGDHVGRMLDVDPEPRVGEVALPAHLGDGDVGIPIGDRSLRRVRFVLDLSQAIRRREDERRVLPVLVVARVVFAGTPRLVDRFLVRRQHRRQRDDGADVEIAVRPAVLRWPMPAMTELSTVE